MSNVDEVKGDDDEIVEADKRSIFLHILKSSSIKNSNLNSNPKPTKTNTNNISEEDITTIFGDDIDDSEILFEKILKNAEDAFKRDEEFKKKNPFYQTQSEFFKKAPKKTRKRKCKGMEEAINTMQNFKQQLKETKLPEKSISTLGCTAITNSKTLSSDNIYSIAKTQFPRRVYPLWQCTSTYTPIFSTTTNPRWVDNKNKSAVTSSKMYTPDHIYNWIDNATGTEPTVPSLCKSVRSDAATCHSIDRDKRDQNLDSPPKTTMNLSTPVIRSTTVRFKPSPPEYVSYISYNDKASISSNSFLVDKENENIKINSDVDDCHSESLESYNLDCYASPRNKKRLHEYNNPKEHNVDKMPMFNRNSNFNEIKNENLLYNHTEQQKIFFEDFIRNLNQNINNNYNMEFKCSMKLKCFK